MRLNNVNAPNPLEKFFNVSIDHFTDLGNNTNNSFPLRYIIDQSFWKNTSSPILFYTGNEADVWNFYNNSGFMTHVLAE
jgi:lysosomal Pro-X carboxypeptidase